MVDFEDIEDFDDGYEDLDDAYDEELQSIIDNTYTKDY